MKTATTLAALALGALLVPACSQSFERSERDGDTATAADSSSGAAPMADAGQAPPHGAAPGMRPVAAANAMSGTVLETMDAGSYTYLLVDGQGGEVWAAAPKMELAVGTDVSFTTEMPMRGFHSDMLDRTFDLVYFVGGITVQGDMPAGHGGGATAAHGGGAQPATGVSVTPAEGGVTVESLFADKADLAGQPVTFRGEVVKWNSGILGRNWLHVQDGTGVSGTNDITVTTDDVVAVGDTVLVHGTLTLDRDFGAGYFYDVIVEEARVTVQ